MKRLLYKFLMFLFKRYSKELYKKINFSIITVLPRPTESKLFTYFNNKKLVGCEIGVHKGLHSKSLLDYLKIDKLYLVDSWINDYQNYMYVMKELNNYDNIKIIRKDSVIASKYIKNNTLDFIYLDANKSFDGLYQDLCMWYPKIKDNGLICGHDIHYDNILKAIIKFCNEYNLEFETEFPDYYIYNKEGVR